MALAREQRPDVVLMDIRMPELDGIEATRQLTARHGDPPTRVLILTTFDLDQYVFDALRAGASGFLLNGGFRWLGSKSPGNEVFCAVPGGCGLATCWA